MGALVLEVVESTCERKTRLKGEIANKLTRQTREKAGKARWKIFLWCPRKENPTCERKTRLKGEIANKLTSSSRRSAETHEPITFF